MLIIGYLQEKLEEGNDADWGIGLAWFANVLLLVNPLNELLVRPSKFKQTINFSKGFVHQVDAIIDDVLINLFDNSPS